jgi:hypothetical protein
LPPHATVVVGGRPHRWLPRQETKLVQRMTRLGHRVVFVPVPEEPISSRPPLASEAV